MATNALLITLAAAGLLAPAIAFSQAAAASGEDDAIDGAKPVTVRIKPVLIDTGSTQGAALGIDYNIQAKYSFSVGDKIGQGEDMFTLDDVNATLRSGHETDQSFDNRQHMFGVTASVSKVSVLRNGDAGTLILNYGSVNPNSDAERERVLGNLDSFRRVNAELSYSIPVNRRQLRSERAVKVGWSLKLE